MLTQIGFVYLFCSLYYRKVDAGFLICSLYYHMVATGVLLSFVSILTYQDHRNKQLASLADVSFYKIILQHSLTFFNIP